MGPSPLRILENDSSVLDREHPCHGELSTFVGRADVRPMPKKELLDRVTPLQGIREAKNVLGVGEFEQVQKLGRSLHDRKGGVQSIVDKNRNASIRIEPQEPLLLLLVGANADQGGCPFGLVCIFQLLQHDLDLLSIGSALGDEMEALGSSQSESRDMSSPNLGILHCRRCLVNVQMRGHFRKTRKPAQARFSVQMSGRLQDPRGSSMHESNKFQQFMIFSVYAREISYVIHDPAMTPISTVWSPQIFSTAKMLCNSAQWQLGELSNHVLDVSGAQLGICQDSESTAEGITNQ